MVGYLAAGYPVKSVSGATLKMDQLLWCTHDGVAFNCAPAFICLPLETALKFAASDVQDLIIGEVRNPAKG